MGPLDTLDFTSGKLNVGSKMGINAVRKPAAGRKPRKVPDKVPDPRAKHPEILDWRLLKGGILAVKIDKKPKEMLKKLFETPGYEDVRIIAAVSPDIDVHDNTELIWGIFTRFDPYLDLVFERTELKGPAVVYGAAWV
ncbi:MAG: UbiD family decarboxylase [Thermodesulfobacteriota bacterium]